MTVIQTVAGGAGGSGIEAIDLSQTFTTRQISSLWTATTTRNYPTAAYDSSKPGESYTLQEIEEGVYCKVSCPNRLYDVAFKYLISSTNLMTKATELSEELTSQTNLKLLPNGTYDLYIGGRAGDAIMQPQVVSGGNYNAYGIMRITVSNGTVTIIDITGTAYAEGNNNALGISIRQIKKIS